MNREFCTLFDVNYLPRGLVLYRSLAAACPGFGLRVFCMDSATKEILDRLELPGLTAVGLDELEEHDPGLLGVKETRTSVEYCWTATPAICLAALEREPELEAITYLDADLMFFGDPGPLFEELGDGSILITPHRYAPEWKHHEARSGIYNVEFLTFRNDERGLAALRWWRERCLEWCYNRVEDGKMGDQAYLNDWPERFPGVRVLQHPGGGLAPWNASAHRLEERAGAVLVDGRPLVFHHYHSLRLHRGPALRLLARLPNRYRAGPGLVWTTGYPVSGEERRLVWEPYLERLAAEVERVSALDARVEAGFAPTPPRAVLEDTLRHVLPPRARAAVRAARRAARRRGRHRDSWKSAAVVDKHRELVLRELPRADQVAPFRSFLDAMRVLTETRPLPEPARFLDFGCGLGHYGEVLERAFPGRFAYTGCDYSAAMVEAARAQWPEREFVVNDLLDNRLDLGAFDVVLAAGLLDVMEDYDRGLEELLAGGAPFVLLHRQRVTDGRSRTDVVPGYEGQTTYRSYLNEGELEAAARRHGRRLAERFHVEGAMYSYLLERPAS